MIRISRIRTDYPARAGAALTSAAPTARGTAAADAAAEVGEV
ncbi:hypothetical protein [Halorussus salinisoli]|nr:hypothetical protein [Halorussus salinisoli]